MYLTRTQAVLVSRCFNLVFNFEMVPALLGRRALAEARLLVAWRGASRYLMREVTIFSSEDAQLDRRGVVYGTASTICHA